MENKVKVSILYTEGKRDAHQHIEYLGECDIDGVYKIIENYIFNHYIERNQYDGLDYEETKRYMGGLQIDDCVNHNEIMISDEVSIKLLKFNM